MSWPNTVSLITGTVGDSLGSSGESADRIYVAVTPVFGEGVHRLLHAATGTVWDDRAVVTSGTPGLFVQVPHVDQPGFVDGQGNAVTDWYYLVQVITRAGTGKSQWSYYWQPRVADGDTVDLDTLGDGVLVTDPVLVYTSGRDAAAAREAAAQALAAAQAAEESGTDAADSAHAADLSAQAADQSAQNAATSVTDALAAQSGAEAAESNAEDQAAAAGTSAGQASTSAGQASTSAGQAASSATAAQTARTGAETARTGAETAQTAAQATADALAAQKGGANGIAPLDGSSKLLEANVPDRLTATGLNNAFARLSGVQAAASTNGALVAGAHNPVDASGGNRTMTLADAPSAGLIVAVSKKDSSANTVTVSVAHLRDAGAGSITLVGQYETLTFTSKADGSWWPIGDHKTKAYFDAQYGKKRDIDVAEFGGSPSASSATNLAAFQAANDAVKAAGGGRVVAAPGIYSVKGIVQDSRVEFHLPGVTLKNPDGLAADIITSRARATTCSCTSGSATVTVASATGFETGAVVAIRGAGGMSNTQSSLLAADITSSQTTITVTTGTAESFGNYQNWLIIEGEIIQYTAISGDTFTGCTRGMYGTTAAAHTTGAIIGQVLRQYALVKSVSGTTVTLDRNVNTTLTAAPINVGVVSPRITGSLILDGNRVIGGAPTEVFPVKWELVRWGRIDDLTCINAESGTMLRHGCTDTYVVRPVYINCSVAEASHGSGGWLFRSNVRCHYLDISAYGEGWVGMYADDRTDHSSEWDGQNVDCSAEGSDIKLSRLTDNVGIAWVGGSNCRVRRGNIDGPRTGFTNKRNTQGVTYDGSIAPATDNVFEALTCKNIYQPSLIDGSNTQIRDVFYEDATTANKTFNDTGTNNSFTNSGALGNAKTLSRDGTMTNLAFAFNADQLTGFYRITAGSIQFVCSNSNIMRVIPTGLRMDDGKDINLQTTTGTRLGTSASQKLGFWGATARIQPSGWANSFTGTAQRATWDTSSVTLVTLAQTMKAMIDDLRSVGIIGP